jgi:hypothetical protein
MTTVLDRLNFALHHAMETDERVIMLGEDILDPYGGAFKVTRGLSTKFPERVPFRRRPSLVWRTEWRCAVCARWQRSCSVISLR